MDRFLDMSAGIVVLSLFCFIARPCVNLFRRMADRPFSPARRIDAENFVKIFDRPFPTDERQRILISPHVREKLFTLRQELERVQALEEDELETALEIDQKTLVGVQARGLARSGSDDIDVTDLEDYYDEARDLAMKAGFANIVTTIDEIPGIGYYVWN